MPNANHRFRSVLGLRQMFRRRAAIRSAVQGWKLEELEPRAMLAVAPQEPTRPAPLLPLAEAAAGQDPDDARGEAEGAPRARDAKAAQAAKQAKAAKAAAAAKEAKEAKEAKAAKLAKEAKAARDARAAEAAQALSPSLQAQLGAEMLDIANYTFTIDDVRSIPASQTYVMDGLRYVSTQPFSKTGNAYTAGSSADPAVVFVGFAKGDFRPVMLLYGGVTLSSGAGLDNSVSFTNGLYTVSSVLQTSNKLAIAGGVTVQQSGGNYYTDFLTNTGQKFNVDNIALGKVTVDDTSALLEGQAIQFDGLNNPSNVDNGALYYIDSIVDGKTFTFTDVNGNPVTNANATGGTVQASNTNSGPEDDYNWGMIITNGSAMPLYKPTSLDANTKASAGFIATRMLLTRDSGGAQIPELQFEGVMALGYKGGSFNAGLGGSTADHTQTLVIDADGNVQMRDSKSGLNEVVFTANFGGHESSTSFSNMTNGVLEAPGNTVAVGDYIRFTQMTVPVDSTLSNSAKLNYSYKVSAAASEVISIEDPTDQFAPLTASSGTFITELAVTDITQGVVTTSRPHGMKVGDVVEFTALANSVGIIEGQKYYVGGVDGDNSFWIKQDVNDVNNYIAAKATGARVYSSMFQIGGLDVGGDVNINVQFNGAYQGGEFKTPSLFQVTVDGDVSIGYSKPGFPTLNASASLNANSNQTTGITFVVNNGKFDVLNWGATVNGMIDVPDKVGIALSGITAFAYNLPGDIEQFAFSGSVAATILPWNKSVTISLGHGTTNGITIQRDADGTTFLQEMSFLLTVTDLKPNSTNTNVVQSKGGNAPKIMSATLQVDFNQTDPEGTSPREFSLAVGGQVVIAVGKELADSNGNWSTSISTITVTLTPDIAVLDEDGVHIDLDSVPSGKVEVDLNGAFNIGSLKFVAQDLRFVVEKGQPEDPNDDVTILISGAVTLPQLRGASVSLGTDGSSGGLYIDTQTGAWRLSGWRIQIPSITAGPFVVQNLRIGFTGSGSNPNPDSVTSWTVEAAGTFGLFKGGGMKLGVELKLRDDNDHFEVEEIGIQLRGLDPGLPIPATEGFLTDIGFEVDNIPTNVSASMLLGAVFGRKINVGAKEYSLVQVILNGTYQSKDITVTGTILIGGGVLGTVTGTLDANWGSPEKFTLDLEGKFFYGIIDAKVQLAFTPSLDYALASVGLEIPPAVPIVGGHSIAEADFMWYDNHDTGQNFILAYFQFLSRWKYGVEFDLANGGKPSLVGTKDINQLTGLIPGDLGGYKYSYSAKYAPATATPTQTQLRALEDDESIDSYGIFNITWDNPTSSDVVHVNVGDGSGSSVGIFGGSAPKIGTWIDTSQGVSLYVLPSSTPGNLLVHASPTAAFPKNDDGSLDRENPDMYVPLTSSQTLNFVLQSNYNQNLDPTTPDWTGTFYEPPSEIIPGTLSVTQAAPPTALGTAETSSDPVIANNTTIKFTWKGIDLNSQVDLFYSYDPTGRNATLIDTLTAAQMGLTSSNLGQDLDVVYTDWDLGGLEPAVPIYVFANIKDTTHVPTQTFAPNSVQSVPAAAIQVGYVAEGTTKISFDMQTIAEGELVATSDVSMLKPGDELVFDTSTVSPDGFALGKSYFVLSVNTTLRTITFSDTYGGAAVTGATATTGTFHVNHVTQIDVTVDPRELDGLPLQATPVNRAVVTSITNGVVTVDSVAALTVGDRFTFGDLVGGSGVTLNAPYYIVAIDPIGGTFTFSGHPNDAAITDANATSGTAYAEAGETVFYATNGTGLVAPHVDVGQYYRFTMTPVRAQFDPAPGDGQGVSYLNELVQYAVFTGNNNLLRMRFNFEVEAVVAGTVYDDLDVNGALNSKDPGLAGAVVYLDDNNNGQLDDGEASQSTGDDGVYAFLHKFLDSDPAGTTYTTTVRVIPPSGTKVTSMPSQPSGGITFTKGQISGDQAYYDFLIAEPIMVGGIVYDDANENGSRDPGEKGLPGVTVVVTPFYDAAQTVTTDAMGAWHASTFTRGPIGVAVTPPGGATVTTPTTTTFGRQSDGGFNFGNDVNYPYAGTDVVSEYDPATGQYRVWYAAQSIDPNNVYSQYQFNDLGNLSNPPGAPSVNFKYIDGSAALHGTQSFLGKWQNDGTPTLATSYFNPDVTYTETHTYLMLVPNTKATSTNGDLGHAATADAEALFALSYDPSKPNYSTVASIDPDGTLWNWTYNPQLLGSTDLSEPLSRAASSTFKFTGGTPINAVGLNLTGGDHYQSRDLAVIVEDPTTGAMTLQIWNHATNAVESTTAIAGDEVVSLLPGDFDGDGREDVAVLTVDVHSHRYYLNLLMTEPDGSHTLMPYSGANLNFDQSTGDTYANLAAVRINGGQQALLFSTQSGTAQPIINAAVVQGGQLVLSSAPSTGGGKIVAMSPGGLGTPASFAILDEPGDEANGIGVHFANLTLSADGKMTVSPALTQSGGSFSGFDLGIKGAAPAASNATSGIVFNDANSNGFQDAGEASLPGYVVRLTQPDGTDAIVTTSDGTDGNPVGSYTFAGVKQGATLQVVLPTKAWLAQNPPPGVPTSVRDSGGINAAIGFVNGAKLSVIPATGTDNEKSVAVTSGKFQSIGKENLVIRTADALYVQRYSEAGESVFDQYGASSPRGYFTPKVDLADLNGDGKLDIVSAGADSVDVFLNLGLGEFAPYYNLLGSLMSGDDYTFDGKVAGDADSGISAFKRYHLALDFAGTAPVSVNGVNFTQASSANGTNYNVESLNPVTLESSAPLTETGFSNNLTGSLHSALSNYMYARSGLMRVTLGGLTPGQTYITTFYGAGFGGTLSSQTFADALGGTITIDQNYAGAGNGMRFERTFVAPEDGTMWFEIQSNDPANAFRLYALTNETLPVGYTQPTPLNVEGDLNLNQNDRFTHAIDFNGKTAVNVDGVPFTQANLSGSNWNLVSYNPSTGETGTAFTPYSGFATKVQGEISGALTDFFATYVGGSQLTLSGLTPGATYRTGFYGMGYGDGVARSATITDTAGGFTVVDQNQFGSENGFQFYREFVATGTEITFTFADTSASDPFHHYVVTNQLVDTGDYQSERLANDFSSGISADKSYTHLLDFEQEQPVTVNGVSLFGAAREDSNYSLVAVDPKTLAESEIEYFLNFNNNVSGNLAKAISDGYVASAAKLTLTGLTPGVTYTTTFYGASNGSLGTGFQTITDSEGGSTHFDQNGTLEGDGYRLTRTYTASSDSITFYVFSDNPNAPFLFPALSNEVAADPAPVMPNDYGTTFAVVKGENGGADSVLVAKQGTGRLYEIGSMRGYPAVTGRVYETGRSIVDMESAHINAAGDLVAYENVNPDGTPARPDSGQVQRVVLLSAASGYAQGTTIIDLGNGVYDSDVLLEVGQVFSGTPTVVALAYDSTTQQSTLQTYRPENGVLTTTIGGEFDSMTLANFTGGSGTPQVILTQPNTLTLLEPATTPASGTTPAGYDPTKPLQILKQTFVQSQNFAAVRPVVLDGPANDLYSVVLDDSGQFSVHRLNNTYLAHVAGADAGGALYDFAVVLPGSAGGTIAGQVFYDVAKNGQWDSGDYGVYNGVVVYLDLNANGLLDATEPQKTPDAQGRYAFTQLAARSYQVGVQLASGYTLTTPAHPVATLENLPNVRVDGVDFGVHSGDVGSDLNGDGKPDLLLTDSTDRNVYVQLRDGATRLATYKIGTLPSAEWSVVGIYDLLGNGSADVVIANAKTGELRAWDFQAAPGVPTLARTLTLQYRVPKGFAIAAVGDLDADGEVELLLGHKLSGEYRLVDVDVDSTGAGVERTFDLPPFYKVAGIGDLSGDGKVDLLVRDLRDGELYYRVAAESKPRFVEVGSPKSDWVVAGLMKLSDGTDADDIVFQEKSTDRVFVWHLGADGRPSTTELEIGKYDGLRLHLAEEADATTGPSLDYRDGLYHVEPTAGDQVIAAQWTFREAQYNNELGLFRVDDAAGTVDGLRPGDAGYAAAALADARVVPLFASGTAVGSRHTATLKAGGYYGLFLIADARREEFLAENPSNELSRRNAFFSLDTANPDGGFHHVVDSIDAADGADEFAWEDLKFGGDRDFNDAVISIDVDGPSDAAAATDSIFSSRVIAEPAQRD